MAGETILVVDDERNIIELAQMYLEQEGFRVQSARDGTSALEMVARQPPALMVLDLMLPEVDGWEVCRRVRAGKVAPDLPIIMLTARDDDVDKIVGLELGADDYVTKPFNPRELVARVKAILRRAQRTPRAGVPVHIGDQAVGAAIRVEVDQLAFVAHGPIPLQIIGPQNVGALVGFLALLQLLEAEPAVVVAHHVEGFLVG